MVKRNVGRACIHAYVPAWNNANSSALVRWCWDPPITTRAISARQKLKRVRTPGSGQARMPAGNGIGEFIRMIQHEVMLALREHDQLLVGSQFGEISVFGTQGGIGCSP